MTTATEESINKLLRDTINLILGRTNTIRASQKNAPRPKGNYADVNMVSDLNIGWEQTNYSANGIDLDESIEGMREMTYSFGFYRDTAKDDARKVRTKLASQSVQDLFGLAGVGLVKRTEVRNISEALEDAFENRAQFDMSIYMVGSEEEVVCAIDSIDINGVYEINGRSVPLNDIKVQDIEIDPNPDAWYLNAEPVAIGSSELGVTTTPVHAFDTDLPLTGHYNNTEWLSEFGQIGSQRIAVDLGVPTPIYKIRVSNYHKNGLDTTNGARNIIIYGSLKSDDFISTYGNITSDMAIIFSGEMNQHVAADVIDLQRLQINFIGALFQYVIVDIVDNYGNPNTVGIREVELG